MPRKRKDDHVVMRNGHPFCMHCGQTYKINLPAPVDVAVGAMNGFVKTHKNCVKTWTEPVADPNSSIEERVMFWMTNGSRGVSSETILAQFVTVKGELARHKYQIRPESDWSHPRDPDDFSRCHKLLEIIPEFRAELSVMKTVSPVWSGLVDAWEELTDLFVRKEYKPMYDRMKQIIDGGTATDD